MADHTPYQKKIIKRYYDNFDAIQHQRLSEMITELYLAEGKKRDRLWTQMAQALAARFSRLPYRTFTAKARPSLTTAHPAGIELHANTDRPP